MVKSRPGRPRAIKIETPADTREAILDVAAELFANKGYAATRNARDRDHGRTPPGVTVSLLRA